MQRLRDVIRSLEEQAARPPAARPNSLYEAGRVGSAPGERPDRMEAPQDARIDSAAELTAEERTTRREPRRPVARTQRTAAPMAGRIRSTLRDPASLQTAILLREVLDPPVSRRPRKR